MSILDSLNTAQNFINNNTPLDPSQRNQFKNDGFMLPSTFSADGNGLPYTKVPSFNPGQIKRNIMTWFIPEFGIVRMYINPNQIRYASKKAISKDRTKGGFTLQYWGEDLDTISINGVTGSAGVEGINLLYEIYRAEQYAFDSVGLTMAANNASADLSGNLINGIGGALGGLVGGNQGKSVGSSLLGGVLGMNSPQNTLAAQNIPSLAQLAFGVEMYYGGWVYRGFFDNMNVTESTDFVWSYDMTFIATQRRGYRSNYFPFHRTPAQGPSQYSTPTSFNLDDIKGIAF